MKKLFFYLSEGFITIVMIFLLGSFYYALNHSVLVNIFVWIFTMLIAHSFCYAIMCLVNIVKKKPFAPFIDGISLFSCAVAVLIVCLWMSNEIDDYSYTTTFSFVGGIPGIAEVISRIIKRNQKKEPLSTSANNVLLTIKANPHISRNDICKSNKLSYHECSKSISELKNKVGLLGKTVGRNGVWVFSHNQ